MLVPPGPIANINLFVNLIEILTQYGWEGIDLVHRSKSDVLQEPLRYGSDMVVRVVL